MQHLTRPTFLLAALASATLALSACNRPENNNPDSSNDSPRQSAENTAPAQTPAPVTTGSASASAGIAMPDAVVASSKDSSPNDMVNNEPTSAGIPASPATGAGPLNAADKAFLTQAAEGGLYEVAVAKLAADKATDPAIKSYATMLVDHHTQANDQLKQVATSKGLTLTSDLPAAKQKKLDELGKATGATFDRQFVQTVGINDHKTDIALFEKAAKNAKDNDVRSFAETTLPTLKEHLTAAQKLPAKSGPKG